MRAAHFLLLLCAPCEAFDWTLEDDWSGWTLAMRFGTSSVFGFWSPYWTNTDLLDEHDTNPFKNADGKFEAFNTAVTPEIRGCLPNGCKTYTLPAETTLLDLFTNTPIGYTSNIIFSETTAGIMEWATYAGSPAVETGWMSSGINYDDTASGYQARVRFGALYNNEGSVSTVNDAVGFGAMEAGGQGVGAGSTIWAYQSYPVQGTIWVKGAGGSGDPHLSLPHGGTADFRGEHQAIYNFLSAANISLNVMTEFADFELHEANHSRHKEVHGSFMTEAHIVARTNAGKIVRVSFYADKIGKLNIAWANGTVDSQPAFTLGPKMEKQVDDVLIQTDYSSLHVITGQFEIIVVPKDLTTNWPERNVFGLHHRLDVQLRLRAPEASMAVAPHGIVGQGWDGDGKAINGELDIFPVSGQFTTSAMAKGAIEGTPNDYKMESKYATAFKFSRFDLQTAKPRDVVKLAATGELSKPMMLGKASDVVGSTEYDFSDEVSATEA